MKTGDEPAAAEEQPKKSWLGFKSQWYAVYYYHATAAATHKLIS